MEPRTAVTANVLAILSSPRPLELAVDLAWSAWSYAYADAAHPHRLTALMPTASPEAPFTYDASGNTLTETRHAPETGLIYFGARYYQPVRAAWISADPILGELAGQVSVADTFDPRNYALYSYTWNSPGSHIDPTGRHVEGLAIHEALVDCQGLGASCTLAELEHRRQIHIAASQTVGAIYLSYVLGKVLGRFGSAVLAKVAGGILGRVGGRGADLAGRTLATPAARRIGLGVKNTATALRSASEAYKGTTRLGHALSKHAGRNPNIWGKVTGNQPTWHGQALQHFRDILRGPGSFHRVTNSKGTTFLEKMLPDGRGVRLQLDYRFKGFID